MSDHVRIAYLFFYIEGAFSFPSQLVVLNSDGSKCSEHTIVPLEIWQDSWYKIIKARQKVYNQLFHSWLKRQIILFFVCIYELKPLNVE